MGPTLHIGPTFANPFRARDTGRRRPRRGSRKSWAVLNAALNVRNGPGNDFQIVTRLLRRDVVWIESAIEDSQGDSDWYAVRTRRNVHGWIPSGPADDPYATPISNQDPFTSCGQVLVVGHYGLINGLRAAHVDRFARATLADCGCYRYSGCIRFSNAGDRSNRRLRLDVHACGAPIVGRLGDDSPAELGGQCG